MIILLPNALEWATRKTLIDSGFALSTVRGRVGNWTVARRVPVLRNVVQMPSRSVVESIFEFSRRPM